MVGITKRNKGMPHRYAVGTYGTERVSKIALISLRKVSTLPHCSLKLAQCACSWSLWLPRPLARSPE